MHHLASAIWPQNNAETRIEWCYKACMEYFFGGGLERVRDKAARRQNYQFFTAYAEDKVVKDNMEHFSCAKLVNAEVESTKSFSAGSAFAM